MLIIIPYTEETNVISINITSDVSMTGTTSWSRIKSHTPDIWCGHVDSPPSEIWKKFCLTRTCPSPHYSTTWNTIVVSTLWLRLLQLHILQVYGKISDFYEEQSRLSTVLVWSPVIDRLCGRLCWGTFINTLCKSLSFASKLIYWLQKRVKIVDYNLKRSDE